ncbi:MAG: long-chain fatty acid--CoA ligase [Bacteroidales bacterium]
MEVTRLFDLLDNYVETYPHQQAALAAKYNGKWHETDIHEYIERTNNMSYGLMALGTEPGDHVGVVSSNRPEWNMLDFAIMQIGAIPVPVYPTISQDDYRYILKHAEIKMMYIEGTDLLKKLESIFSEMPDLKEIWTFDAISDKYKHLDQLIELGKKYPQPQKLQKSKQLINQHDLATIIYTSGTTGSPKGVMLSHSNIVNNFKNIAHIPQEWNKKALSFLPVCHAYERMLVYLYHYLGMSVYYAESIATIASNIKEINPTMMSCVPRVLEKIYEKLYKAGSELSFVQKKIYYWAFNLATRYSLHNTNPIYRIQYAIANKLIYQKWREAIGGNFDIVVSGGSQIQKHMAAFFTAIGLPIFEGYGLSETSPVIAVSQRGKNQRKFGTVGAPLSGVEVVVGEHDEILCRGHNVMLGYYKDPELTAQVIDADGWFHTGDIGKFTPEGLLVITGRLKSVFKTSFGKYVNPHVIETKFTESPFMENVMVVGENQKFAAALISPSFEHLKSWCVKHHIPYTTNEEMITHPEVKKLIQKEVKKYNQFFGGYEQVKKYQIVSEEWTQQKGFLSPTLKIKRNVLESYYSDIIDELFR